jgi:hypothetical protein
LRDAELLWDWFMVTWANACGVSVPSIEAVAITEIAAISAVVFGDIIVANVIKLSFI